MARFGRAATARNCGLPILSACPVRRESGARPRINSTLLAISEINRRGGILGREVEVAFHDTGGDIDDVTRTASDIVASEDADLIMGSHISAVRVALRKVVAGQIPYMYTPVYEGGERTPGVMAIGETPRAQWRPAIEWLANTKHASNWYLIGSDYVWPWLSHRAIKKYIADAGGRVVGEEFVPIGEHNHSSQLARIRAAKPDVVLITLIGTDSVVFNRTFGEQGLGSSMLRLAGAMDETVLLGIGADNTENLFCASGYFIDRASRENDAFRCQYEASFGRNAPPLGSIAQSNYEGLRFLETIAARAGSLARSRCSRRRRMWTIRARAAPSAFAAAVPACRSIWRQPTASTSSWSNSSERERVTLRHRRCCKIILEKENISVSSDRQWGWGPFAHLLREPSEKQENPS